MSARDVEVADLVQSAADYIEAHGLYKGGGFDPAAVPGVDVPDSANCAVAVAQGVPCCVLGALAGLAPDAPDLGVLAWEALWHALGESVSAWNDNPDTKQDDVVATLRKVADDLAVSA